MWTFGRNHGEHELKNGKKVDFTDAVIPTRLIVRDAKLIKNFYHRRDERESGT